MPLKFPSGPLVTLEALRLEGGGFSTAEFSLEGLALQCLHPGLFVSRPGGRGGRDDQEHWGAGPFTQGQR